MAWSQRNWSLRKRKKREIRVYRMSKPLVEQVKTCELDLLTHQDTNS
jgi:hypothetical protein